MSLSEMILTGLLVGLQLTTGVACADQRPALAAVAQEEAAIRAAAQQVAESVVQIRTIGGLDEVDRTLLPDGPTSGLVISPDGWIVSSAFNFVHQPSSILVTFASGEQAPAELIAKDHSRMLVLIKAQGVNGLPVPQLAPAEETRVGQWAVVIGRAFRPDRLNISVGIVSAIDRMLGKAIQTDANVSTANYGGPLVDIRGRVLGVVVPMSPQAASELAGAEWYDSGIGFAVPLAGLAEPLERMKQGQDQHAGVLGIGMAAENPHGTPAALVAVLPTSPAGKAGLQKGDEIVEIDGRQIATQTDLRFALGTKYAGDNVRLRAKRGAEVVEQTIELVGELQPFRHAFLGILPIREEPIAAIKSNRAEPGESSNDDPERAATEDSDVGVGVRWVFPGSPAAAAGIRPGDRVASIDDAKVNSIQSAIEAMNNVTVGTVVAHTIIRDDKPLDLRLIAERLPTNLVGELPEATKRKPAPAALPELKLQDLKLAEFPENCRVYLPRSAAAGQAAGVLIWLHAPGEPPGKELFREWQAICEHAGILLVVPTAADPSRWDRTELEFLRRLTERVLAEYPIDRRRVVVFGQGGGGSMAYLTALMNQDRYTGVATSAATLPRTIEPPNAQPTTRLAVFAGLPSDNSRRAQAQLGLKKLADAGYPVTATTVADQDGKLSTEEREQLARWLDSLDRF